MSIAICAVVLAGAGCKSSINASNGLLAACTDTATVCDTPSPTPSLGTDSTSGSAATSQTSSEISPLSTVLPAATTTVAPASPTPSPTPTPSAVGLDTTFNATGYVSTLSGSSKNYGNTVAIQTDGKIVVAGQTYNGTNYDIEVVRYNSNGSLDSTFGTGGKVNTTLGFTTTVTMAIAIQPSDQKILVAQNAIGSDVVVRYNTDGSLDNTFGTAGLSTQTLGATASNTRGIAVQTDGKIVVVGGSSTNQYEVYRLNSDGSLDTTFGGVGYVVTVYSGTRATGRVALVQSDGKIVVPGMNNYGNCITVVRYATDGTLDTTFNSTGKVCTPILAGGGGKGGYARAGIIQADGKIVAAGYYLNGTHNDGALVRYNTDGSLDTSFNSTGMVALNTATNTAFFGVIEQSDGKLITAGVVSNGTANQFALMRFNSDGTPDLTFNGGDSEFLAPSAVADVNQAMSMAVQADGKLVVAGYSSDLASTQIDFLTMRFNP